ncbi:MAG: N-acetyltransferase [Chloroflexi bacterium]|nr:N-acetyltransferase [Chloroflexota bacterium]
MDITLRAMQADDWPAVQHIYEQGIATGIATFETTLPDWQDWHRHHLSACRLVAVAADEVVGWAALSPVSNRCVYAGVAEVSVYVAATARGQGVGYRLLSQLVACSEQAGLWTLQAGIFPENEASLHLHRRCDFRVVGRRQKLGHLHGVWHDVLLLERRSQVV